jgi:hypothetical protein
MTLRQIAADATSPWFLALFCLNAMDAATTGILVSSGVATGGVVFAILGMKLVTNIVSAVILWRKRSHYLCRIVLPACITIYMAIAVWRALSYP